MTPALHSWRVGPRAYRYIDGWYNPHRIQRELGWLSPDEYEEAYHTSMASGGLASPTGAR